MKKYLMMLLLCACAWVCAACAGKTEGGSESGQEQTETSAETTAVTTTKTQTETTVTTTTAVDYLIAEDMKLNVKTDTVRPSKCTAELTNSGDAGRPYTMEYRLYSVRDDGEVLYHEMPDYTEKEQKAAKNIAPGETIELEFDWAKRYGDLTDGTYILEVTLERVRADEEDETSPLVRQTARAKFTEKTEGYVPQFIVDPENIKPTGITLTIQNAKDTGRTYAPVYSLYDESRSPRITLISDIDRAVQLSGNNYMPAGGQLVLNYDWSDTYGSLLNGEYVLEISLLADGEKEGKIYRVIFEVTE